MPAEELPAWLASAQDLVRTYFTLEDPRRFDPEACEFAVEIEVAGGVPLRGIHRPARPGADRRTAGGRLQDRSLTRTGFRGQGALSAEVLCADDLPAAWRRSGAAEVDLSGGRDVVAVRADRNRNCSASRTASSRCGRPSPARWRPATSRRGPAACAGTARTRRSVRSSAGPRRRTPGTQASLIPQLQIPLLTISLPPGRSPRTPLSTSEPGGGAFRPRGVRAGGRRITAGRTGCPRRGSPSHRARRAHPSPG